MALSGTRESAPPTKTPSFNSTRLTKPGRRAFHRPWRQRLDRLPTPSRCLPRPPPRRRRAHRLETRPPRTQHPTRSRRGGPVDFPRDRIPQPHRRSAHRRADGDCDADHHGRLRPTRTRHHDRAHPRRAGRRRSQRAQGRTPTQGRRRRCRQSPQLREKGIAATDIAKMLGVSRATVYRYLSDGASLSA